MKPTENNEFTMKSMPSTVMLPSRTHCGGNEYDTFTSHVVNDYALPSPTSAYNQFKSPTMQQRAQPDGQETERANNHNYMSPANANRVARVDSPQSVNFKTLQSAQTTSACIQNRTLLQLRRRTALKSSLDQSATPNADLEGVKDKNIKKTSAAAKPGTAKNGSRMKLINSDQRHPSSSTSVFKPLLSARRPNNIATEIDTLEGAEVGRCQTASKVKYTEQETTPGTKPEGQVPTKEYKQHVLQQAPAYYQSVSLLKTLVDIQRQERKGHESVRRKKTKIKKFSVPHIQVNIKHEDKEQIYDNYSKPLTAAREHELALTSESPIRQANEGKRSRQEGRRQSLKTFNRTPLSRYFMQEQLSTRAHFHRPLMASQLIDRHSSFVQQLSKRKHNLPQTSKSTIMNALGPTPITSGEFDLNQTSEQAILTNTNEMKSKFESREPLSRQPSKESKESKSQQDKIIKQIEDITSSADKKSSRIKSPIIMIDSEKKSDRHNRVKSAFGSNSSGPLTGEQLLLNTYRIAKQGNKSLMQSISLKQMQALAMPKTGAILFDKQEMENFVPIKVPVKVKTWKKQQKKENVRSMLKVYCNSRLRSQSPTENRDSIALRANCNTRISMSSPFKSDQKFLSHKPMLENTKNSMQSQPSLKVVDYALPSRQPLNLQIDNIDELKEANWLQSESKTKNHQDTNITVSDSEMFKIQVIPKVRPEKLVESHIKEIRKLKEKEKKKIGRVLHPKSRMYHTREIYCQSGKYLHQLAKQQQQQCRQDAIYSVPSHLRSYATQIQFRPI